MITTSPYCYRLYLVAILCFTGLATSLQAAMVQQQHIEKEKQDVELDQDDNEQGWEEINRGLAQINNNLNKLKNQLNNSNNQQKNASATPLWSLNAWQDYAAQKWQTWNNQSLKVKRRQIVTGAAAVGLSVLTLYKVNGILSKAVTQISDQAVQQITENTTTQVAEAAAAAATQEIVLQTGTEALQRSMEQIGFNDMTGDVNMGGLFSTFFKRTTEAFSAVMQQAPEAVTQVVETVAETVTTNVAEPASALVPAADPTTLLSKIVGLGSMASTLMPIVKEGFNTFRRSKLGVCILKGIWNGDTVTQIYQANRDDLAEEAQQQIEERVQERVEDAIRNGDPEVLGKLSPQGLKALLFYGSLLGRKLIGKIPIPYTADENGNKKNLEDILADRVLRPIVDPLFDKIIPKDGWLDQGFNWLNNLWTDKSDPNFASHYGKDFARRVIAQCITALLGIIVLALIVRWVIKRYNKEQTDIGNELKALAEEMRAQREEQERLRLEEEQRKAQEKRNKELTEGNPFLSFAQKRSLLVRKMLYKFLEVVEKGLLLVAAYAPEQEPDVEKETFSGNIRQKTVDAVQTTKRFWGVFNRA